MRVNLKWKFTVFLAGLLLLTIVIMSFLVLRGIKEDQRTQIENTLQQQANEASLRVWQAYLGNKSSEMKDFFRSYGQGLAYDLAGESGTQVILYDMMGREAGNSLPMGDKPEVKAALDYVLQGQIAYVTKGESLIYLAPLNGPDGQIGVVQFSFSLSKYQALYRFITRLFVSTGIAVLLFGIAVGYYYVSKQTAAIGKLRAAAGLIRQGAYVIEPPLKRNDELGDLGQGIYEMSRGIESNIQALTEEKHNLQLAVEKLQMLEKQQKQFINNISHELKTPLTSIKAYSDLLAMYKDDPRLLEEARDNIGKEASRLYELVEKALHLSALEKYDFEYNAEAVELAELLTDICGRMNGKAVKFKLSMSLELYPALIRADKKSLIHIFVNLLDNAIKYNVPYGIISVKCRVSGECAWVEVYNSGAIIPEESRAKIFEPFYTVNKDRSRQGGGTGLGLPLVKQLTEKQGGMVALEESDNQGMRFIVSFPLYNETKDLQV